MRRSLFILLAIAAAFLLASCGPPDGYDIVKQNAIDAQAAAKANEADTLCPTEWNAAEQAMNQALEADAAEEWTTAMPLFEQAKNLYDVAKMCAIKKKEEMAAPPPPPPPPVKPVAVKASVEAIFFDFDMFNIRVDQLATMKADADSIKNKFADHTFLVTGYCDVRGTDEYNMALGMRRATTVYNFLVASGVAPARLQKKSGGETSQFGALPTEAGFQANRRVMIEDLGK